MDNSDIRFFEEEKKTWDSFKVSLRTEDRELFREMLSLCSKYATAIRVSSKPSSEALFITILFLQHRILKWVESDVKRLREEIQESGKRLASRPLPH